jgi:hypothetical protein
MRFDEILKASVLPIAIAVIFYIIYMAAALGSGYLIKDTQYSGPAFFILVVVFYLGNLGIFAFAGFRAGRKNRADAIEGGAVSAVAFFVSHTIVTMLSLLFMLILYGSIFGKVSETQAKDIGLAVGALGALSIMASLLQYFMTLVIGLVINFLAGAIAAYSVTRRIS